jgi:hypothetical protein
VASDLEEPILYLAPSGNDKTELGVCHDSRTADCDNASAQVSEGPYPVWRFVCSLLQHGPLDLFVSSDVDPLLVSTLPVTTSPQGTSVNKSLTCSGQFSDLVLICPAFKHEVLRGTITTRICLRVSST